MISVFNVIDPNGEKIKDPGTIDYIKDVCTEVTCFFFKSHLRIEVLFPHNSFFLLKQMRVGLVYFIGHKVSIYCLQPEVMYMILGH